MIQNALDMEALNQQIYADSFFIEQLNQEIGKVIIGQKYMTDRLLIGLLTGGHVLLEGMPGLAKTLAIKTLAAAVDGRFSRIQFTPDLLPSDVTGTLIYNPGTHEFTVRKGPVFANFILADEINRAPAKVQSALLEAMQEKQVTIGNESFTLPEPFLVLATQNPIEQEGTYPLPEAQTDRFMLKLQIGYPSREEEKLIIRSNIGEAVKSSVKKVVKPSAIMKARASVRKIYMDEKIENYILDLVFATREPDRFRLKEFKNLISYGASPRAGISMALAAKANAFMNRRGFVTPDDVRNVCRDVMRHRIGLSYEAEAENINADTIMSGILSTVPVP